MNVISNTPRHFRSHLSLLAQVGSLAVHAISPAMSGRSQWHFGVIHDGAYHIIGKGVAGRDTLRVESHRRYNQAVKERHLRKVA